MTGKLIGMAVLATPAVASIIWLWSIATAAGL